MNRINNFVLSLNKTPINWADVLKGGAKRLNPHVIIESWNNLTYAKAAARQGNFVVDTVKQKQQEPLCFCPLNVLKPYNFFFLQGLMYLDYPVAKQRNKTHDIHDYNYAINLRAAYAWDAVRHLVREEARMWVGGEACLWTERAGQVGNVSKPKIGCFSFGFCEFLVCVQTSLNLYLSPDKCHYKNSTQPTGKSSPASPPSPPNYGSPPTPP